MWKRILLISQPFLISGLARAQSTTCDPGQSEAWSTLRARRTYSPSVSTDDTRALAATRWFFVPVTVQVTSGQSGNHWVYLSWRDPDGTDNVCAYRGNGTQGNTSTCSGNGDRYNLASCTSATTLAAHLHDGLIEATQISLHIQDGDHCAPTEIALPLASPPDRDGDGTPDCLEPSDRMPPFWPSDRELIATLNGGEVTLVWTEAVDDVAVAGYRLFEDGQAVGDFTAATAQLSNVEPNVVHTFQVEAFDAAGNLSNDGPRTTAIVDTLAPIWPAGASLTATRVSLTSASLSWAIATDNVAVAGYQVFVNGLPLAITSGQTVIAAPLDPSIVNVFTVQSLDAAGNISTDNPTTQIVLDDLAPTWPPASVLSATVANDAVTFVWTAAVDDVAVGGYVLFEDALPIASVDGGTLTLALPLTGVPPNLAHTFQIQALDRAGNTSADGPTTRVYIDHQAPSWPAGSLLTAAPTGAHSAHLAWTPATDEVGVTGYTIYRDGLPALSVGPVLAADIPGLDPLGTQSFQVQAFDAAGNLSNDGPRTTLHIGTPAPGLVAPPVDTSVAATVLDAFSFLFTGDDPVQTGADPAIFDRQRACIVRGQVSDATGAPLQDVAIGILNHGEFGTTRSHLDGTFDLVVNGGGDLVVTYARPGYTSAQRHIEPRWNSSTSAPDVVLVPLDPNATEIENDFSVAQVARGTVVADGDGAREATLIFPAGAVASILHPDGTTEPLGTYHVRATELTVGLQGPLAMPGDLPPSSGYTYAVDISVDEAVGARSVVFSTPVSFYVQNFLQFPVGETVPAGFYDPSLGQWVAADSGRIIKLVSVTGGLADLDTDGDNGADDPSPLGITAEERAALAQLYVPGTSLWRLQTAHFTTWDFNWARKLPLDAIAPNDPPTVSSLDPRPAKCSGSILECENQVLAEDIPITGTSMSLHYQSDRTAARTAERTIHIPLLGATVPSSMIEIDVDITIAGQRYHNVFAPAASSATTFTWNGLDAYGRELTGSHEAVVRVGYVYPIIYSQTQRFALPPAIDLNTLETTNFAYAGNTRRMVVPRTTILTLNHLPARLADNLGGWSLSAHHLYDFGSATLYHGDGDRQRAEAAGSRFLTSDGGGTDVIAGPDGSIYYDSLSTIWRLTPDGQKTRFAGTGVSGYRGDGGPALLAGLAGPSKLALGADGSVYVIDQSRVRKIDRLGFISTVAGNGVNASTGDGGLAINASLAFPSSIAVGPDNILYVAELHGVREVTPDGLIRRFAGTGTCSNDFCYSGDGGPALLAHITVVGGIAVGKDGSVYIGSGFAGAIRRVDTQGIITRVVGNGLTAGTGGDGLPALQAETFPAAIRVAPDGRLCTMDHANTTAPGVLRCVEPDGIIHRVAGTGQCGTFKEHDVALVTALCGNPGFDFLPDGTLIAESGAHVMSFPRWVASGQFMMPSMDGSRVYILDAHGRHLATKDALLGTSLLTFTYAGSFASSVTDADGNAITIDRSTPTSVVLTAPFGQQTQLSMNDDGLLESVTDPLGQTVTMTYDRDLLTSLDDPFRGKSTFQYDPDGRLLKDSNAGGGYQQFSRVAQGSVTTVTRTTAMGRATTYRRDLSDPSVQNKVRTSAGMTESATRGANGSRTLTYTDGTRVAATVGPDPRFGMDAPLTTTITTTTAGARTLNATTAETVTLANANDPLSLTSLTRTTTINGSRTWTTAYAASSRTVTQETPAGRQVSVVVDSRGHVTRVNQPGRLPETIGYDSQGRVTGASQGTRAVTFDYDSAGNMSKATLADGAVVRATYDALSRPLALTRPDQRQIQLAYELAGRRQRIAPPGRPAHTEEANPEARTEIYEPPTLDGTAISDRLTRLDLDGQLLSLTHGNGDALTVERDASGRPIHVTTPRGVFSYDYDPTSGRRIGAHAPEGQSETYTYDGPLLLNVSISGAVTGDVSFSYDANMRLADEAVNGQSVAYLYDPDDLLTQAGALMLTRDSTSGDITATRLGSLTTSLAHNGYGELDHQAAQIGASTLYLSDVLVRDGAGRITARHETIDGESHGYDYAYDTTGRLTDVAMDGAAVAHYDYDDNGNRLAVTRASSPVEASTHDAQDRMLSAGTNLYTYTSDGAVDTKVDTATGATTFFQYDMGGNLLAVILPNGDRLGYIVDAAGRRVGRTLNGNLTHGWIYGAALRPAAELDASGQVVSRFIYASRAWVPDYMVKNGTTYALVTDAVGSVRLAVDATTGTVAQRLDYDEFGRVLLDTNPGFQPFAFGGGLYESSTGLVRLGARDYDSINGRWITKDPLLFRSRGANFYEYAAGDPINRRDPTGLFEGPLPETLPTLSSTLGTLIIGGTMAFMAGFAAGTAIACLIADCSKPETASSCEAITDSTLELAADLYGNAAPAPEVPEVQLDSPGDPPDDCKQKASDWQLESAGIDPHTVKTDYGYLPNSRFEICKCKSGGFAIKRKGCRGPILERI